jgi:hypothetical protein
VPNAVALFEALVFTFAGAAATLVTVLYSPWRNLLAYAWRMWLWGSIGFIAANALLLAILSPFLSGTGIAGGPSKHQSVLDFVLLGLVLFGPLVFSSAGVILGCVLGWHLARRHAIQVGV